MNLRSLITAFAVLAIAGCTATGGEGVKQDYSKRVEYTTSMNWQAAFREIKDEAISCYQGGGGYQGTTSVDAHLYSELGEAEVGVNNGPLGTYLYIEILKDSEGATVVGYTTISTWNKQLDKLEPVIVDGEETFDFGC